METESEPLMTAAEVAALCKVAKMTVFRWAATGDLKSVRLSDKVIRFRKSDVTAFIDGAA